MKKYLLSVSAIALAVGFTAFTVKEDVTLYRYDGLQSESERKIATNYTKMDADIICLGSRNECAVVMSSDNGDHPDFTNVTFQAGTGFPNGGGAFLFNLRKN
jgi:hypothetical protein